MGANIKGAYSLNESAKVGKYIQPIVEDDYMAGFKSTDGTKTLGGFYYQSGTIIQLVLKNSSGSTTLIGYGTGSLGVNCSSVGSSAKLQVDSTAAGFLPPRMTSAQRAAISSPATGLIVYDTDLNQICVYIGTKWQKVTQTDV